MNWSNVAENISDWIGDYAKENGIGTLVVGVSGGVDSAVTSTLSAMTGIDTIVLNMPIHQDRMQNELSERHIEWLKTNGGMSVRRKSTFLRLTMSFVRRWGAICPNYPSQTPEPGCV